MDKTLAYFNFRSYFQEFLIITVVLVAGGDDLHCKGSPGVASFPLRNWKYFGAKGQYMAFSILIFLIMLAFPTFVFSLPHMKYLRMKLFPPDFVPPVGCIVRGLIKIGIEGRG